MREGEGVICITHRHRLQYGDDGQREVGSRQGLGGGKQREEKWEHV